VLGPCSSARVHEATAGRTACPPRGSRATATCARWRARSPRTSSLCAACRRGRWPTRRCCAWSAWRPARAAWARRTRPPARRGLPHAPGRLGAGASRQGDAAVVRAEGHGIHMLQSAPASGWPYHTLIRQNDWACQLDTLLLSCHFGWHGVAPRVGAAACAGILRHTCCPALTAMAARRAGQRGHPGEHRRRCVRGQPRRRGGGRGRQRAGAGRGCGRLAARLLPGSVLAVTRATVSRPSCSATCTLRATAQVPRAIPGSLLAPARRGPAFFHAPGSGRCAAG